MKFRKSGQCVCGRTPTGTGRTGNRGKIQRNHGRSGTFGFPASLTDSERFSYAVRKHWSIENQLHWALDIVFDEDSSRARKDMSPLNLNILRKTALALCKHADFGPRVSMKKKRFSAALVPDRFLAILFANSKTLLMSPFARAVAG